MHTYVHLMVCTVEMCQSAYGDRGQQLYDAARDGKASEDVALLSNPEARSFMNWQDTVACPTSPTPLLAPTLCFCEYISVY